MTWVLGGWLLAACSSSDEASCDEATVTLESIADDPQAMAATEGVVCGSFYEARTETEAPGCGDTGLGDPVVVEGVYALWPSNWGVERRENSLGVVVLASDGTELEELPDYASGETIVLEGIVRYAQVLDPCANQLYPSAYFEVDGDEVGLE